VSDVVLTGNYLNGPCNTLTLVDLQSTGTITGTKMYGNYMGGNTNTGLFGRYMCLQNNQSRPLTNDDAGEAANPNSILWPTTAGGSAFKLLVQLRWAGPGPYGYCGASWAAGLTQMTIAIDATTRRLCRLRQATTSQPHHRPGEQSAGRPVLA